MGLIQSAVQVLPEERALVVATPDPWLVLQKINTAFDLGDGLVGMPHGVDECVRLSALGIQVESPIERYYRWPRDKMKIPEPFKHQPPTSGFFLNYPHSYCLSSIGVGKTMSAAWAADYLMELGIAKRCVIIGPLSSLERTWGDSLFVNLPHRSFNVLHGSADRRRRLLAELKDFYIINFEGVAVLQKELAARADIDIVILDELAECGKRGTNKWKSLEQLLYPDKPAVPKPWVWGMTATPIPNSPEDAYPQMRLVTPATVPKYFTQFRNLVMEHQSQYVWTPRKDATKTVFSMMRPAIRFTRDECLDLPDCIYSTRDVEMSAEQTKHYKAISKELYTEVQGGKVTAMNEGVKLSKLLQISCGCVYDSAGVPREIDAGNRIETLMQLIDQVGEKVIVFVPFTEVTGMLYRALSKYWPFAVVTGGTSKNERDKIFGDFQNPKVLIDIVAHPKCMAHSLTLTEASTIIWYAAIDSNRVYEQANGRITRAGQKYTANIIHLAGSAVERKMYKRLQDRQSEQGLLLDMVQKGESLI